MGRQSCTLPPGAGLCSAFALLVQPGRFVGSTTIELGNRGEATTPNCDPPSHEHSQPHCLVSIESAKLLCHVPSSQMSRTGSHPGRMAGRPDQCRVQSKPHTLTLPPTPKPSRSPSQQPLRRRRSDWSRRFGAGLWDRICIISMPYYNVQKQ